MLTISPRRKKTSKSWSQTSWFKWLTCLTESSAFWWPCSSNSTSNLPSPTRLRLKTWRWKVSHIRVCTTFLPTKTGLRSLEETSGYGRSPCSAGPVSHLVTAFTGQRTDPRMRMRETVQLELKGKLVNLEQHLSREGRIAILALRIGTRTSAVKVSGNLWRLTQYLCLFRLTKCSNGSTLRSRRKPGRSAALLSATNVPTAQKPGWFCWRPRSSSQLQNRRKPGQSSSVKRANQSPKVSAPTASKESCKS